PGGRRRSRCATPVVRPAPRPGSLVPEGPLPAGPSRQLRPLVGSDASSSSQPRPHLRARSPTPSSSSLRHSEHNDIRCYRQSLSRCRTLTVMTASTTAWGWGLATVHESGQVLDVWFPSPALGVAREGGEAPDALSTLA